MVQEHQRRAWNLQDGDLLFAGNGSPMLLVLGELEHELPFAVILPDQPRAFSSTLMMTRVMCVFMVL